MIYYSCLNYSTGLKIRIPTVGTIFIAKMKAKTATNSLLKRGEIAVGTGNVRRRLQK